MEVLSSPLNKSCPVKSWKHYGPIVDVQYKYGDIHDYTDYYITARVTLNPNLKLR